MARHHPGEGSVPCKGHNRDGSPCGNNEIAGMEFCLHHVPDDMLEEAEETTGMRRCRHRFGETDACRYIAVSHTVPPQCKVHGANAGSHQRKLAAGRQIEAGATERLGEIMSEHAAALEMAEPVENPLEELLRLAGEVRTLKNVLRKRIGKIKEEEWRYRGTTGEQVRAEIVLYERATERLASMLVQIAKLNIEDALARIKAEQMSRIERALQIALAASGADIEGQDAARRVLIRELTGAG